MSGYLAAAAAEGMVDELIVPTAKSYVTALITGISMNDGNGIWSSQDGHSGRSSVFILRVLINRVRYSCAYTGQKVAPGIRVYIIFTIVFVPASDGPEPRRTTPIPQRSRSLVAMRFLN